MQPARSAEKYMNKKILKNQRVWFFDGHIYQNYKIHFYNKPLNAKLKETRIAFGRNIMLLAIGCLRFDALKGRLQ